MPGNSLTPSYLLCVFTKKWLLGGYPSKRCVPCWQSLLAHGKSCLGKGARRDLSVPSRMTKSPQIRMTPDMLLHARSSL